MKASTEVGTGIIEKDNTENMDITVGTLHDER